MLIGHSASIRRTFGPRCNAQALLACGGESLAAHASFDPDYSQAQKWIRSHAVGPAVLSPVLINGLVGALVEAAFPQSVPDSQTMKEIRPLIVGVNVNAKITVTNVSRTSKVYGNEYVENNSDSNEQQQQQKYGYQVDLKTEVLRVRDDAHIAEGTHSIWIPDYQGM
jgi:hypothetical protein